MRVPPLLFSSIRALFGALANSSFHPGLSRCRLSRFGHDRRSPCDASSTQSPISPSENPKTRRSPSGIILPMSPIPERWRAETRFRLSHPSPMHAHGERLSARDSLPLAPTALRDSRWQCAAGHRSRIPSRKSRELGNFYAHGSHSHSMSVSIEGDNTPKTPARKFGMAVGRHCPGNAKNRSRVNGAIGSGADAGRIDSACASTACRRRFRLKTRLSMQAARRGIASSTISPSKPQS